MPGRSSRLAWNEDVSGEEWLMPIRVKEINSYGSLMFAIQDISPRDSALQKLGSVLFTGSVTFLGF